jgi:hypothetical protein
MDAEMDILGSFQAISTSYNRKNLKQHALATSESVIIVSDVRTK